MTIDFVLHVGLQKTASSTLQRALFSQHPGLLYIGKRTDSDITKGVCSKELYGVLRNAIWNLREPLDVEFGRAVIRDRLAPLLDDRKTVLGSWEALGNSGGRKRFEEIIRRLSLLFGSCRVMICLRKPVSWSESLYLQELEGNYVRRNRSHFGRDVYLDFERWLDRKGFRDSTGKMGLSYPANIRNAVGLLGRERVGIFAFEKLVADPAAFYGDICDFLGIDTDVALRLTAERRFNPTLTESQLLVIRNTQDSLLRRTVWPYLPQRYRRRLLKEAIESGPEKARALIPPRVAEGIDDAAREFNRWVLSEYDLPLAEYGYPL